jgi:hypothetical protein
MKETRNYAVGPIRKDEDPGSIDFIERFPPMIKTSDRGEVGLGELRYLAESGQVRHGYVRKNFSVQLYAGMIQALH